MIWKPKVKELTYEEALLIARKEMKPFWYGVLPQIAGIKTETGFTVVPLDPDFPKKSWLILFIDPTDYSGQSAQIYAKEWYRRYNQHSLNILLVLVPIYRFWQTSEHMSQFTESQQILFPIFVDVDQTVAGAFGVSAPPKVLLLHQGQRDFEYSDKDWLKSTEVNIQHFLRSKDPGLSLLPSFVPNIPMVVDRNRMEFGYGPRLGKQIEFDPPGFAPSPHGYRIGRFHGFRPKQLKAGQLFVIGDWIQDTERLVTSDSNAVLSFMMEGTNCSIVAESLSKTEAPSLVQLEIDGKSAYDSIAGAHLVLEDSGASVIKIKRSQLYHVLQNIEPRPHEITLRLSHANSAPVAVYGVRFGDGVELNGS